MATTGRLSVRIMRLRLTRTHVCTDLSDKKPDGEVGTGRLIRSGSLASIMASTPEPEWQEVSDFNLVLGAIFNIFITSMVTSSSGSVDS